MITKKGSFFAITKWGSIITKWGSSKITKWRKKNYKVRQVLQRGVEKFQSAADLTK